MTESTQDIAKSLQQDGDILKGQNGLIFDPFNPNNKEITQTQVESILDFYGVPSKVLNFNLYIPILIIINQKNKYSAD